jgi:hypothetical protein
VPTLVGFRLTPFYSELNVSLMLSSIATNILYACAEALLDYFSSKFTVLISKINKFFIVLFRQALPMHAVCALHVPLAGTQCCKGKGEMA